ncbi:hypothetical protein Halha_0263 [Halobacteroides halobius DSM 5150]|uniref:Outer membrane protein beta-barrel domain-containing protein n=1 Tax=Halobacteroides halobius (strain ATCC 35273 / DSM 5150 / MD-1) TaxID=748449 RepID=L0K7E0_HALHC|nr:hypothetical protein [Halobacteroides halobius]AGB40274.1 hypothetical protein Halha_0263 [Halobacteroides halobius DSM 5150]
MKKVSLLLSLVLVLALAVPVLAESNVEISGNYGFTFWEFSEKDGKANYSMNGIPGAVFGIGDWKQSTSDGNEEQFEMGLNLNMKATVDDTVTVDAGFIKLDEEMDGELKGSDRTFAQDLSTMQDNPKLKLENLTLTAKPDFGEVIITNNFNYNFNNKVLAAQFDGNWGDMMSYGEGVLVKSDIVGLNTQFFIYKTDQDNWMKQGERDTPVKQMVYGTDLKKDLGMGKVGALIVRTHDQKGENAKMSDGSDNPAYDKDLDNTHIAVNGEFKPMDILTVKGEFITAKYGDDVEAIHNTVAPPWLSQDYSVGTDKQREDTNIIELSVESTPLPGLSLTGTYKDVGEDYVAVQGNSHERQSWFGDETFNPGTQRFDYNDGTGYEKGFKVDGSYMVPVPLMPQVTGMFTQYLETRSKLNRLADDQVTIGKVGANVSGDSWEAETYYRYKNDKRPVEENGVVFNEVNVNGSYTVLDSEATTVDLTGELSYYTGDDEDAKKNKNFSKETRVRAGVNSSHKLNDKVDLTASYDFGIVQENSDLLKGKAMQNLIKAGLSYKVSQNTTLNVNYHYDAYQLKNIDDKEDNFGEVMNEKEANHVWYNGQESWQDRTASYEGYTTHSVKATYNVSF